MARLVAETFADRLAAAQAAVADAGGSLRLKLRHRRELVLAAIDEEGMTQREVARILGVAQSRVAAILASPDDDDA